MRNEKGEMNERMKWSEREIEREREWWEKEYGKGKWMEEIKVDNSNEIIMNVECTNIVYVCNDNITLQYEWITHEW